MDYINISFNKSYIINLPLFFSRVSTYVELHILYCFYFVSISRNSIKQSLYSLTNDFSPILKILAAFSIAFYFLSTSVPICQRLILISSETSVLLVRYQLVYLSLTVYS